MKVVVVVIVSKSEIGYNHIQEMGALAFHEPVRPWREIEQEFKIK
jgi:hypothetical protein